MNEPAVAVPPRTRRPCGCWCPSSERPDVDYESDDDFCRCECHDDDSVAKFDLVSLHAD